MTVEVDIFNLIILVVVILVAAFLLPLLWQLKKPLIRPRRCLANYTGNCRQPFAIAEKSPNGSTVPR